MSWICGYCGEEYNKHFQDLNKHIDEKFKQLEDKTMAGLSNLQTAVAALQAESVKENALLAQLHTDLQTALANGDDAAVQAAADAIGQVVAGMQATEAANADPNAAQTQQQGS